MRRYGVLIIALLALSAVGVRGQTWVQKIGGAGLGNPLVVNPLNHDILYSAAGTNRIYISRSQGYSWANYGNLVGGGGVIKSICVSPLDTLRLLAGVETSGGTPDHISRTTDGGATWTEVWTGSFSYYGQPVEFAPEHPDTVYVMGADTLWRSTDFGASWDTVSRVSGFNTWCDASIRPDSANILLLGDNTSGIWKTTDAGVSWTQKYATIGEIPSIAIDPFHPRVAYASKYSGGGGIVKTTNGGETWFNLTVPSTNRDTWWVTCSREHEGYVYYGTYTGDTAATGIYLSRNSGSTWQRYSVGLWPSAVLNYGLLAVDSMTVIAFQGNGLYKLQFPTSATLTEPNGGEYFQSGTTRPISWTTSYLPLVRLDYTTNNGSTWTLIADSLSPAASPYSWSVPYVLSTACKVRVSDTRFSAAADASDSTFVISSALITLAEPQPGRVWHVGASKEIAWSAAGVAAVRIDHSIDSGSTWRAVAQVPAALGSFLWRVPESPSERCLIRLSDTSDSIVVGVSGLFTIALKKEFSAPLRARDNAATEDTLAFGAGAGATDGIDLSYGESELGPAPPAGTFDLRWIIPGTNGTEIDIRDTLSQVHKENLFAGIVQPGPGGYPVTLFWSPESLGEGTFILRDALTRGSIYSADMRRDSTLVINDGSAASFEIVECTSVTVNFDGNGGWALISLPVETGDRRKIALFPYAGSGAYAFAAGYLQRDSIDYGTGYWLKIGQTSLTGCPRVADTIGLHNSWNIIGSISEPVAVSAIVSVPESLLTSSFFGYQNGYSAADTIFPGKGYWVKSKSDGLLVISSAIARSAKAAGESRPSRRWSLLEIIERKGGRQSLLFGPGSGSLDQEMPPPAPEGAFDARFTPSLLRQEHPENFQNELSYPISVKSASNEIFISWHVENEENFTYILSEHNDTRELSRIRLTSDGSTSFRLHRQSSFALKVLRTAATAGIPHGYSMGEFYPNPFNPTTRFAFSVPSDAQVNVSVYSLLGRRVATLVDELKAPGFYQETWNGTGENGLPVSSGVYYVRMSASSGRSGSFVRVQKVLFLK